MSRLAGKVAIVTGAGQGIGAGIADEFERQGATVVRADISAREGIRLLDVASAASWQARIDETIAEFGRLDVLVNNAAVGGHDGVAEISEEEWDRVIGINQTGTFLGCKFALARMIPAGSGVIVNISSILGARAVPGTAAYHASKAAVLGMTRNIAVSYAADGIRANAIVPGWISTPSTASQADHLNRKYWEDTPLPQRGEPRDVALAAVYLASDESSFVTGIELPVDGGYLAR